MGNEILCFITSIFKINHLEIHIKKSIFNEKYGGNRCGNFLRNDIDLIENGYGL